jgi:hypothetical protein
MINKAQITHELRRFQDLLIPFFDWDEKLLRRSYAPGKWTAREILCHVVDTELVLQTRVRHILSEPYVQIVPFDQAKWAKALQYPQRSLAAARRLWVAGRETLIELVDLVPEPLFGREGKHPEHASYRAWDVVNYVESHARHHYGQLLAIRDGRPWTPGGSPETAPAGDAE